jgi:hypothetical protein
VVLIGKPECHSGHHPNFIFFIVDKDWAECFTSRLAQFARAVQRSCATLIEKR